jgi:predicted RNA binding protein YcfA (HicA-like mRNA interferase family)
MKLPRDLSGRDLARLLARLGYVVTRQKGSHMHLTRPATSTRPEHHISVPNHDELKLGTLAEILNRVAIAQGITRDELMELLFD